jgi:hypothetical protein
VPPVCVLDPDGDIVRFLARSRRASLDSHWACYHTQLHDFTLGGRSAGIVGCAVAARSFPIVCCAHVTNSMAQSAGDFEKGPESGSLDSLRVLEFIAKTLLGAR